MKTINRILIADDNPFYREAFEGLLANYGYDYLSVSSGKEALDKIAEFHPDVIIMDVKMPGMDGLTACRAIKKNNHEIYIILLTACGEEKDIQRGKEAGADEYMIKPVSPGDVIDKIEFLKKGISL